ncbi:MAG TPA: hypothetical protein PK264_21350, partial [Hyphomicrobiaceae bacterium]|nr:hypothetical protein [Hyphomicrobiaceae bacterium]
ADPLIAAECDEPDPDWSYLPDRDVRRAELARNYRINHDRYQAMKGRRGICRASLRAQFPAPRPSKE